MPLFVHLYQQQVQQLVHQKRLYSVPNLKELPSFPSPLNYADEQCGVIYHYLYIYVNYRNQGLTYPPSA